MKQLTRQWAVVHHYHDGSGILRVWGPFDSEDAARNWSLPEHMGMDAFTVVEIVEPFAFDSPVGEG